MSKISKKLLSLAIVLAMVLSMTPVISLPAAAVTADPSTATDPMAAAAQNIADVKAWETTYGALFKTEEALESGATVSAPCPFCSPNENITWTAATYFSSDSATSAAASLVKGAHKYMTTNRTSSGANFLTTKDDCTDYTAADAARCVYLNGFNLDSYRQRLWVGRGLNLIAYGSEFTQTATKSESDSTTDTSYPLIQMNEGPVSIYGGTFVNESTGKALISANSGDGILNLYDGTYTSTAGVGVIMANKAAGAKINIYGSKLTGGSGGTIVMTMNDTINVYGNDTYKAEITGGTGYVNGETYYTDENSATHYGTNGGNVYMDAGTFNMYGGSIYGGTATGIKDDAGSTKGGRGGNVYIGTDSTFNMYGGEIYGGKIEAFDGGDSYGGNVMLHPSTARLNMSGDAEIYGGQAKNGGNVMMRSTNKMTMTGNAKVYGGVASTGQNIYLMGNEQGTAGPKLTMSGNATVYGGSYVDGRSGNIRLYGSTLIMKDNATVRGGATEGSAVSVHFSKNPLIVLMDNATIKNETGTSSRLINDGRILITEGWAGEAYAALVIDDGSRGYTYGEQVATTRALRGTYNEDTGEVTATDATFTGKLYVSSNNVEALADPSVTGGIVLAEEPATNEPVFGVFDPAGHEGMAYCEACYKQAKAVPGTTEEQAKAAALKEWTEYEAEYYNSTTIKDEDTHEHLFLKSNIDFDGARFLYMSAGTVCLNLNGCNVTKAAEGKYSAIHMMGGTLNIMDSKDTSVITASDLKDASTRANVLTIENGTCNLYGGTFKDVQRASGAKGIARTVMVLNNSTLNLYEGATINGSALITTRGTISVSNSTFNMYGGEIIGRTSTSSSGDSGSVTVGTDATFEMSGGTIRDGHAGSETAEFDGGNVRVTETGTFIMKGGEIKGGTATDMGANIHVNEGGVFTWDGGKIYSFIVGDTAYATFEEAYAAAGATGVIGLVDSREFVLTGDAYVALMAGATPSVSGAHKLYAMDTTQDDYTGTAYDWTVAEDTTIIRDVMNPVTGNRYLNITVAEGEGNETINSTRLDLALSTVTLRAATNNGNGLYYKALMSMSKALANKVITYGVVMSLDQMPREDFEEKGIATFTAFETNENPIGVTEENDYTVKLNSGSVFGIMKTKHEDENGNSTLPAGKTVAGWNAERGQMDVYANAYLQIDLDNDGTMEYIMSNPKGDGEVAWSMHDVLNTIDGRWGEFEAAQDKITKFYGFWHEYGMNQWSFSNIKKV